MHIPEFRHEVLRERIEELELALKVIRDIHADTGQLGASCAEGCGGRWPCSTYAEANHALTAR